MKTKTKKRLHYIWTKVRVVKVGYVMVAFACLLLVAVFALRANNQKMIQLRSAVYQADESNGDVEGALRELRQYVYAHMNTDLSSGKNSVYPPIQLKYTYERLLAEQQEGVKQANQQIYTEAQQKCEQLYPESYSGGPRVPCIQEHVANSGVQLKPVPDSLYKFNFISPVWSSDLAGWSLIGTALLLGILLTRIALPYVLKKQGVI